MDGDETDYENISSAESEADEHEADEQMADGQEADEQEVDEHGAEPGIPVSPGSNAENPFIVDDGPNLANHPNLDDEPNLANEPPLFVDDGPQFVDDGPQFVDDPDGDYVNNGDGQSSESQSSSNESESDEEEDSQTDASSEGQDQNNVPDSDAEEPPWSLVHCQEFCQPHWQRIHNKSYRRKCRIIRLTQAYNRVQRENRELRAEVEDLRAQLAARRQGRGRYKATCPEYMRRRHEPEALIQHMAEKTNRHPNYRLNRDLRTLQGLDYILCLRGLKKVDFFDFDKWKNDGVIVQVRDFRFVMDVKNNVCRPKAPLDAETSEIRNLAPTVPDYVVESGDWEALERFLTKHFGIRTGQIPIRRDYAPVRLQPVSTFIVIDSDSEDDSDTRSSVRFGSGSGILEEGQSASSATSAMEEDGSNPDSEQPMASTESNPDEVMDFDVIDPADDEMSDEEEDRDDFGDAMDLGE
ncbi:unnamed protein product [Clonostachys byssicola]|uniref:Uncharacterized protein n=1 Tax=Clonostachys byssicola TaxID=160290 RepID=A0A9N9UWA8_9HYPO|nr:unnamed protein product [Clonostachys byssicola]